MTKPPRFSKKTVDVNGKSFIVQIINFDNGNFVSISEGVEKLGSMVVSLGTGPTPITTTIIPAKNNSLFLKITAERVSTTIKGITIVSSFLDKELEVNVAKTIMEKTMEMVRNI